MLDTILEQHSNHDIIHEIGRPTLLKALFEGVPIVSEFRQRLNNYHTIVADFKGYDAAYYRFFSLSNGNGCFNCGRDHAAYQNCPSPFGSRCVSCHDDPTGLAISTDTYLKRLTDFSAVRCNFQ